MITTGNTCERQVKDPSREVTDFSGAGLVCCRGAVEERQKKQTRDERRGEEDKDRGQHEQRTEEWKQSEREMMERQRCPPGVQVGRFTWRGQAALQRQVTQRGLMEVL